MTTTVTIPKTRYNLLKEQAKAYEVVKKALSGGGFFDTPSTKKRTEIIRALKNTKIYNKKFLESIKRGLVRSDFFA